MSFEHVLMSDDFAGLRVGPIQEAIDGPYWEMHAQPASPEDNLDGWQCRTGHWSLSQPFWECVQTPAGKRIRSRPTATVFDNLVLAKGDYDWRAIELSATVTLRPRGQGWGCPVGLVFRYLDSTRYYAAVVDQDGQAKLLRRERPPLYNMSNFQAYWSRPRRPAI